MLNRLENWLAPKSRTKALVIPLFRVPINLVAIDELALGTHLVLIGSKVEVS